MHPVALFHCISAAINRSLRALLPATGGAGAPWPASAKSHWLLPLLILCCLVNSLAAATEGLFTYTDNGTSITITGYPTDAVGAIDIPPSIIGKPVTSIGGEAVVKRLPDWFDPADQAATPPANLGSQTNRTLGRGFRLLAFRWLNPDEI